MFNKLRAIRYFVRLVDSGSFTAVADEIGATTSLVSKEISKLEQELGARLLHRSTRNLKLTDIGEGYLLRARRILLQVDDAEAFVQQSQQSPKGKLRINLPLALGLTELNTLFAEFMQQYPEVSLDIQLSDAPIDLIEQGFDLGFRASSRTLDTAYIGRPLTQFCYRVCASPTYLANHPRIEKPQDLSEHNCFIYSYFAGGNVWPLGEGIAIQGNLKVNNTLFMRRVIEQGLGVGFLPDFVAKPALATGKLEEVLNTEDKPLLTLYALYPARQFVPPVLNLCVQYLERWFEQHYARA